MKLQVNINPDNQPCSLNYLKYYRDLHREAPIITNFGYIDGDRESMDNLKNAVDHFNDIPSVTDGIIKWTMADNSIVELNNSELSNMLTQALRHQAIRNSQLHDKYNYFKSLSTLPLLKDIKDINYWIN